MDSRRLAVLSFVAITTICLPSASWAVLATVTDDAYIVTNTPNAHNGADTFLSVVGGTRKAFIKFNLGALPSGVTATDVAKATLTVWANVVNTPGSIDVKRVTSAWTEAGITASTAPTLGIVDAAAVPVTTKNTYVTADVTALVQAWIGGTLANNGLALVARTASTSVQFDSKEASTGQEPRLDITLKGPAGSALLAVVDSTGQVVGPVIALTPLGTNEPDAVVLLNVNDLSLLMKFWEFRVSGSNYYHDSVWFTSTDCSGTPFLKGGYGTYVFPVEGYQGTTVAGPGSRSTSQLVPCRRILLRALPTGPQTFLVKRRVRWFTIPNPRLPS